MGNIIMASGMVLSSMPVGEFDRRIVLLTKERGKIAAFAKGARRMNSPLMGVTQPFAFGKFELYEGRTSYDIRRADISNYFTEVSSDLDAICYACYFAELADYYGRENLDASQILNLLYMTLRALANDNIPDELIRYIYEIKLISINGECPNMFECAECRKSEGLHYFSMSRFGIVCDSCVRNTAGECLEITESAMYTLQYIVSSGIEKLYTFTVREDVLRELAMVAGRIRSRVIDKKMKSLEMLEMTNGVNNSAVGMH